jgi:hypothetical protein
MRTPLAKISQRKADLLRKAYRFPMDCGGVLRKARISVSKLFIGAGALALVIAFGTYICCELREHKYKRELRERNWRV